jgi:hypothetical protein
LNSSLYFFSLFFSFTSGLLSTSILVSVKTGELHSSGLGRSLLSA